jgi:hypothetical protein
MVDIPFLSALEADVVAHLDRAIGLNVQPGKKITERILKSDSDGQTSYTKSCDEGSQRDAQIIKKNHPSHGDQYDLGDEPGSNGDLYAKQLCHWSAPLAGKSVFTHGPV